MLCADGPERVSPSAVAGQVAVSAAGCREWRRGDAGVLLSLQVWLRLSGSFRLENPGSFLGSQNLDPRSPDRFCRAPPVWCLLGGGATAVPPSCGWRWHVIDFAQSLKGPCLVCVFPKQPQHGGHRVGRVAVGGCGPEGSCVPAALERGLLRGPRHGCEWHVSPGSPVEKLRAGHWTAAPGP